MPRKFLSCLAAFMLSAFSIGVSQAGTYRISILNPGESSFALTPLWYGFDSGAYNLFDVGSGASTALEDLAEEGIVSGLQAGFSLTSPMGFQGVLTAPGGFPGAPVIEAGELSSAVVTFDSTVNRFFNFASMVIPSNDAFIGRDNSIELFDAMGAFLGGSGNSITFDVLGSQIWDAGTEVNNGLGAAFSATGGVATSEGGVVQLLPAMGLDNFIGTSTAAGNVITNGISPSSLVARITITAIPEPSSLFILGSVLPLFLFRRTVRNA